MSDKSWLLNASAIKAAKACIKEVEAELGIRLRLTHPEFLQMLNDYAELCESAELSEKVNNLNNFAAVNTSGKTRAAVVSLNGGRDKLSGSQANAAPALERPAVPEKLGNSPGELISYQGKSYPRFFQGKEFKGLYRGQPRYR